MSGLPYTELPVLSTLLLSAELRLLPERVLQNSQGSLDDIPSRSQGCLRKLWHNGLEFTFAKVESSPSKLLYYIRGCVPTWSTWSIQQGFDHLLSPFTSLLVEGADLRRWIPTISVMEKVYSYGSSKIDHFQVHPALVGYAFMTGYMWVHMLPFLDFDRCQNRSSPSILSDVNAHDLQSRDAISFFTVAAWCGFQTGNLAQVGLCCS